MDYTTEERQVVNQALKLLESKLRTYSTTLSSPQVVVDYLRLLCEHEEREQFIVLFLNTQHQLIRHEVLFQGTINEVNVYPREIVKQALNCNAQAVILSHNHPSGIPTPSTADRGITQLIMKALATVGVEVLDHIIIGHQRHISFVETGAMPNV